jgi:hypothetical protein
MSIYKIQSDGASLPWFERKRIIKKYGQSVMDDVDWCGYRHDARMNCLHLDIDGARALFHIDLHTKNVPCKLVHRLIFGLYIYDKSPKFLKRLFKRSVKDCDLKTVIVDLDCHFSIRAPV